MKLDEVLRESVLMESKARTPHPEDSVFSGLDAAQNMVDSLFWVIENPRTLSIKFDGFPALIFGYHNGKFTISDKYMFDKGPEYLGTSPNFWREYDSNRGKNRSDLYDKLENIWQGLKAATGSSEGFFWGDLMWGHALRPTNDVLTFKPNTVTYSVPVSSDLGKRINGTLGGIVVHQYYKAIGTAPSIWNGQGLQGNQQVAILHPTLGISFRLTAPTEQVAKVNQALQTNQQLDQFLQGMAGVAKNAIQKYLNKVATKQTNERFDAWTQKEVSGKQYNFLFGENGYLIQNKKQLDNLFALYSAIANLKNALAAQLESQVQGIQQSINGQQGGEGFVFNTPNGLIKLVNRGGFSAAHFAKN
jgi:hypothetical protein